MISNSKFSKDLHPPCLAPPYILYSRSQTPSLCTKSLKPPVVAPKAIRAAKALGPDWWMVVMVSPEKVHLIATYVVY